MTEKVFFLGAGFSKHINLEYPLLKTLTNNVLDNFNKNSLAEHFQHEIAYKMKNDLEYLLTYLSTDLPWKSEKTKAMNKALYIEITEKIQKYFYDLELHNRTDFSNYSDLANFMLNSSIITLNYDLMVEKLIYSIKPEDYKNANRNFKGFYKAPIVDLKYRNTVGGFGFCSAAHDERGNNLPPLLKLHGSINWLWSGTNSSDPIYCIRGDEGKNLKRDLAPYIIPPVLDKNSFYNNNILKGIWQQAHELISDAKEIYIIGFSFPPTDVSLKYLFHSALRDNQDINIYVVNYDSENNIRKTYENIFESPQLCCNISEDGNWKYIGSNGFNNFINDIVKDSKQDYKCGINM